MTYWKNPRNMKLHSYDKDARVIVKCSFYRLSSTIYLTKKYDFNSILKFFLYIDRGLDAGKQV